MKTFLETKGLTSPELEDADWLEKLHFMVDFNKSPEHAEHKSPGKERTAVQMPEDVLAFEHKMTVFARDIQTDTLSHFPSLKKFKEEHNHINCEYLYHAISKMQNEFGERFREFRQEKAHYLSLSLHWTLAYPY